MRNSVPDGLYRRWWRYSVWNRFKILRDGPISRSISLLFLVTLLLSACGDDKGTLPGIAENLVFPTPSLVPPINTAEPTGVGGPVPPKEPSGTNADALSCDAAAAKNRVSRSKQEDQLVVVGALNLRAGPGTDCAIVDSLGFGAFVSVGGPEIMRGGEIWRHLVGPDRDGYAVIDALQPVPLTPPDTVPILMYHHITDDTGRYFVSPADFADQVAWLKKQGYVTITPTDLYNALYRNLPLPEKPIMLTIDDGNLSSMEFAEILGEVGFRGVYFVNNVSSVSADQIRYLDSTGEVCGHTATHMDLSQLSYEGQYEEIAGNKSWVEGILGKPMGCFAYPFGEYNEWTDTILADVGYKIAFDAWDNPAPLDPSNRWHIERIEIYGETTLDEFIDRIEYGG